MTRTPLALAALACAAVPGLDPTTVAGVGQRPGHQFDIAFVDDTQHRRWVVRAPMSAAAGAQLDVSVALLGLLSRRLPFSVPAPRGFAALSEGSRAVVYPYIAGRPLDLAHLPSGPGIAAELGRALAALHNLDLAVCEEAGLTSYDPETYRTRRLSDLDRAAATGHVPAGLLSRWERSLEDVSLWRFAPTLTHGDLTGDEVLAVFEDEGDATSGRVRGLTGWENAKVADPADDFATLVTQASPSAFDSVLEAYSDARMDRPDKHLERRARLAGELKLVSELLTAVGSGDPKGIQACADRLRKLDAHTFGDEDEEPVVPTVPTVHAVPLGPNGTEDADVGGPPSAGYPDDQNPENQIPDDQIPDDQNPDDQNPDDQNPDDQIPDDQNPENQIPDDQNADNQNADDKSPDNQNADNQNADDKSPDNQNADDQSPGSGRPDTTGRFEEAELYGRVQALDDPRMTPRG